MSHPNAALTPRHRLTAAKLVVDNGWPISEVATRFQVSWPTVKRWVDRYLTAAGVLHRAVEWFANRGVTVERVLSDNGGTYRSRLWRDTCEALAIRPKYTRPYRPQTNGKVERFHRTMADGWAYARCYRSEAERRDVLETWLHHYNQHRPHTACGNQPPFARLTNLPGQYS